MAKNPRAAEQEPPMQYSFMSLIKRSGEPPIKVAGKATDPLSIAKDAIVKALDEQKGYLALVEKGEPLPLTPTKTSKKGVTTGGTKAVLTWFTKAPEGYWTSIRYGQLSIPLGGATGHFIGTAEELATFYDAVKLAIVKGELDGPIGELQAGRSAKLKEAYAKRDAAAEEQAKAA